MRYRIIDLTATETREFVNLTVASFAHPDDAIAVCGRLPIRAEVIDGWNHTTLYRN